MQVIDYQDSILGDFKLHGLFQHPVRRTNAIMYGFNRANTKQQLLQIWLLLIGLLAGLSQAQAQTSFNLSANYPVPARGGGDSPYAVTAFMNVDGRVDLVVANADYNTLTVLTNDGSGNFSSNAAYAVGSYPDSVAAADVNGDGYVDLICANQWDGTLTVLTNNGSGGFGSNATYTVGYNPFSVVAADLNGDGKVDIACANRNSNSVSVFFNNSIFPLATATPPLNVNPSGSGIQVSWPSASAGWSLQQNPNLTTMPWGPSGYSGYTISDNGTTKSLTIPSPPGNMFFRLFHP
jgi:hypothetical protein